MQPPEHMWIATPTQVALLQSGQEDKDMWNARDGSLRSFWDTDGVRILVLPINSDPQSGKLINAGQHWSLLIVRRWAAIDHDQCSSGLGGGEHAQCFAVAELHDSLSWVPPLALRA